MRIIDDIKFQAPLAYSLFRKKLLISFPIVVTNRCNSRCNICYLWKKEPKVDLEVEIVKNILSDKVVSRKCSFILTGGEFLLHPKYDQILSLFDNREYILLSNGLMPEKLIKTVREFKVKKLSLSLDGSPETYKRVRGVDGYASVERVVEELKGDPVKLFIQFVVNPWNSRKDFLHVMNFCRTHNVRLFVGYYTNIEYYDTLENKASNLYEVTDMLGEERLKYHELYNAWSRGQLRLPCFTIFLKPVVRPNGDVELCEIKRIKLGNLHDQSLNEIWTSKRTSAIRRRYMNCNDCWGDCARTIDLDVISNLKLFYPNWLLDRLIGRFDWEKV